MPPRQTVAAGRFIPGWTISFVGLGAVAGLLARLRTWGGKHGANLGHLFDGSGQVPLHGPLLQGQRLWRDPTILGLGASWPGTMLIGRNLLNQPGTQLVTEGNSRRLTVPLARTSSQAGSG